jgi:hypothetical protein
MSAHGHFSDPPARFHFIISLVLVDGFGRSNVAVVGLTGDT